MFRMRSFFFFFCCCCCCVCVCVFRSLLQYEMEISNMQCTFNKSLEIKPKTISQIYIFLSKGLAFNFAVMNLFSFLWFTLKPNYFCISYYWVTFMESYPEGYVQYYSHALQPNLSLIFSFQVESLCMKLDLLLYFQPQALYVFKVL
jgi:hypothetical protein